MPFMVGSTGSVLPAPKRFEDIVLVVNENEVDAAGAKAIVDDTTVKAKIDPDKIFIFAFGFCFQCNRNVDSTSDYEMRLTMTIGTRLEEALFVRLS